MNYVSAEVGAQGAVSIPLTAYTKLADGDELYTTFKLSDWSASGTMWGCALAYFYQKNSTSIGLYVHTGTAYANFFVDYQTFFGVPDADQMFELKSVITQDNGSSQTEVAHYMREVGETAWTQLNTPTHTSVITFQGGALPVKFPYTNAARKAGCARFAKKNSGGTWDYDVDLSNITADELAAGSFVESGENAATVTMDASEAWAYVRPVTSGILSRAELLLMADDGNEGNSPKWADRSGNDHHAQLGSAAGADTNDPEFLSNRLGAHVRLPGSAGNYVSSADVNLLDADTAHLQQSIGDWVGVRSDYTGIPSASVNGFGVLRATVTDAGSAPRLNDSAVALALPASLHTLSMTLKLVTAAGGGTRGFRIRAVNDGTGNYGDLTFLSEGESVRLSVEFTPATVLSQIWAECQSGYALGDVFEVSEVCVRAGSDASFVPSLRIVGDLEYSVKLSRTDWTSTTDQFILGNYPTATRTFGLRLFSDDTIYTYEYDTGGTPGVRTHTIDTTANLGLVDGQAHVLRYTLAIGGNYTFFVDGTQYKTGASAVVGPLAGSFAGPGYLGVGGEAASSLMLDAKVFYVEVRDGIDGPIVARYDAADAEEPFDTQTGSADGRTWTYNRSGSGLYVADRRSFGLHTDDYFEVADHADLDVGLNEDITIIALARSRADKTGIETLVAKGDIASEEWWMLRIAPTLDNANFMQGSASARTATGSTLAERTTYVVAGRRDADTSFDVFIDGVEDGTTTASAADLTNASPLYVGARLNAVVETFYDGEIMAVALFREALTDDEIAQAGAALLGGGGDNLLLLFAG